MNEETSQPKFTIGKRFWTYIRSQRKDQIGIPILKDGEDEITDSKMKAELLSKQYETVFTEEDTSKRLPYATQHPVERIEDLHISVVGVQNLLTSLNHRKTNGPDQLPQSSCVRKKQRMRLRQFSMLSSWHRCNKAGRSPKTGDPPM